MERETDGWSGGHGRTEREPCAAFPYPFKRSLGMDSEPVAAECELNGEYADGYQESPGSSDRVP